MDELGVPGGFLKPEPGSSEAKHASMRCMVYFGRINFLYHEI
jgi:hypothetical protein